MIETVDHRDPDPALLRAVRRRADASFMQSLDDLTPDLLPQIPGYRPHLPSKCCLKMRNVEPHRDDWQDPCALRGRRPPPYRAMFWLLQGQLHLQVSDDAVTLYPGNWVLFDDRRLHCVVADRQWIGLAVQYVKEPRRANVQKS
jgi:hypothetical protein